MSNREISETPNNWVVVKLIKDSTAYYKVFATWTGGYLDGDRWKLNSGITKIESDDSYYYIYGASGSCYACNKKAYGVASFYGENVLNHMITASTNHGVPFEKLEDRSDWETLLN